MKVFGGKEQEAKVTDASVTMIYLPEKQQDPYKIKKYDEFDWKLPVMEKAEIAEMKAEAVKNAKDKKLTLRGLCFVVGYKLGIKTEK